MSDGKSRSYIQVAREEQQQYTSALMRENERLRSAAASLEEQHRSASEELARLRDRFVGVAQENARYAEQYHQIETHSSNLANLYVASYQLHASVDRQTVLQTIQEIVINLIGSEEVAIFELVHSTDEFRLASSFGIDAARLQSFHLGDGRLGRTVRGGRIFADDSAAGGKDKLTACVPLKIGDQIIGAILVFRLLDHKLALEPVDHELFDLLAVHASTALYCATLHNALVEAP